MKITFPSFDFGIDHLSPSEPEERKQKKEEQQRFACQAEPHNYRNRITSVLGNRNPCNSFLMVKMASGMDHGRVRPMTTTTSHNMAAIQLITSHAVLDYIKHL